MIEDTLYRIKHECDKRNDCEDCPFLDKKIRNGCLVAKEPFNWDIDRIVSILRGSIPNE